MTELVSGSPVSVSPVSPPWILTGSAVALLSSRGVILLAHYETSPVGAYDEWALGVLTVRGPCIVEMLVTSALSMRGGRENWGFPKQLANLKWTQRGAHVEFCAENDIYRLRACGPRFPLSLRGFCTQTLNGQEVRVPLFLQGKARMAWRGKQIALLIEDFIFEVKEATPGVRTD
jgi:hypothetical protein